MRRLMVLAALAAAAVISTLVVEARQGNQPAPSADLLEVEKLADNLFVLRYGPAGGNTAVFVTSNGVVLVDTKITGWGQPLIEKVRTLTDRPITTIINTHTHFDHVNGNVEFPASVEIIAHENTARYMREWNPVTGFNERFDNPFERSGGRGLPTRTYQTTMTLGSGADQIDLFYYGPAHTGGDTFVVFRSARVMHAGDVFPNKGIPIMDRNNGGSGVRYADTVARAAETPGVDRVITGHGPTMTMADLREFGEFNREFVDAVQQAKRSGQTIEQFINSWRVPARFAGYAQPQPQNLRPNTEVVWDETN